MWSPALQCVPMSWEGLYSACATGCATSVKGVHGMAVALCRVDCTWSEFETEVSMDGWAVVGEARLNVGCCGFHGMARSERIGTCTCSRKLGPNEGMLIWAILPACRRLCVLQLLILLNRKYEVPSRSTRLWADVCSSRHQVNHRWSVRNMQLCTRPSHRSHSSSAKGLFAGGLSPAGVHCNPSCDPQLSRVACV